MKQAKGEDPEGRDHGAGQVTCQIRLPVTVIWGQWVPRQSAHCVSIAGEVHGNTWVQPDLGTEQERRPGLVSRRVLPVCFARLAISFCFGMDPPIYQTWEISRKKSGSVAFRGKVTSVSTGHLSTWAELAGAAGRGEGSLCAPHTRCVPAVLTSCLTGTRA